MDPTCVTHPLMNLVSHKSRGPASIVGASHGSHPVEPARSVLEEYFLIVALKEVVQRLRHCTSSAVNDVSLLVGGGSHGDIRVRAHRWLAINDNADASQLVERNSGSDL